MSTKTRALMLLAMLAASLVLAAAQAPGAPPGGQCPADCESRATALQGTPETQAFLACAKQAQASGQKIDPCCEKVAGYAEVARDCSNCPNAIPRLSAWLQGQGLNPTEVISACTAKLG